MPRSRPATTGYERLAQADQIDSDSENEDFAPPAALQSASRYAPITAAPRPARSGMASPGASHPRPSFHRRTGSNSGVDIKAINARLERWADEIASRFKRGRSKSQGQEDERLEIHHSVFQAPEGVRPVTASEMAEAGSAGYMTKEEFDVIVESVRSAIRQEVHPSMISQGSSGSYFARDPDGKIVGVFKPKDEEPYAAGNPKWNKWIHRNLFPCFFGRAWSVSDPSRIFRTVQLTDPCASAVSSRTCPMSAKRPLMFSTVSCKRILFHTPMLYIFLQNHSTTRSGTVGSSRGRSVPSPRSLAVFRSFSRVSRMPMSSCANTRGQINIGLASAPTNLATGGGRRGGRRIADPQARYLQTGQIPAMTSNQNETKIRQHQIVSCGPIRSNSHCAKSWKNLSYWTTLCGTRTVDSTIG